MSTRIRPYFETLFVRNMLLGPLLERFLVAAIASVLVIRFYLQATGYPQIGGGGLHIAHLLWGGLFMLVALVLLLAFWGRRIQHLAAILGGIGFGAFIDELGKFITSDNNYFFQPAIAIIYTIFVLLFLGFRTLRVSAHFTQRELLANAIEQAEEVILRNKGAELSPAARSALIQAGQTNPTIRTLVEMLQQTGAMPPEEPGWDEWLAERGVRLYERIIRAPWFPPVLLIGCVGYALLFAPTIGEGLYALLQPASLRGSERHAVATTFLLLSSLASAGLLVVGAFQLRRSRLAAYLWFKRSLLVSILMVQTFLFYLQQLGAVTELAISIALLILLNGAITRERMLRTARKMLAV